MECQYGGLDNYDDNRLLYLRKWGDERGVLERNIRRHTETYVLNFITLVLEGKGGRALAIAVHGPTKTLASNTKVTESKCSN